MIENTDLRVQKYKATGLSIESYRFMYKDLHLVELHIYKIKNKEKNLK